MRSPAAAIAWEIARRHRWGMTIVGCYLLVLTVLRLVLMLRGMPLGSESEQTFAFSVIVPSGFAVTYFLAVFSFGFSGNLAGRHSIYPTRMFTLPVTSTALAGWPMLYGTTAMVILWLATRLLAEWPAGLDVPVLWPAVLAAAFLAWMQALAWMPFPLPGLRVLVTILLMVLLDTVIILGHHLGVSEPAMSAIIAPNLLLAFAAARYGIARARRGDTPDGLGALGRIADFLPRRRCRLTSPAVAQAWFEWQRYGRALPTLVGILLPFELSMVFLFRDTPAIVGETLLATLITPPIMAVFVAATISRPSLDGASSHGVAPFTATRPLTSASLIAAKLRATIRSTLVTWLMLIVAVTFALQLSGTTGLVIEWVQSLTDVMGHARAVAVFLLGLAVLVAATWKQLVQSLCIGLSGRRWLVKGSIFTVLSVLTVMVPLAQRVLSSHRAMDMLLNALPWILALLVFVKVSAAAWIAVRLYDSRQLGERTLILGAAGWAAAVLAVYGVLVWLISTMLIPGYFLMLVAILVVPLVRLSAAPLALAWNRHR